MLFLKKIVGKWNSWEEELLVSNIFFWFWIKVKNFLLKDVKGGKKLCEKLLFLPELVVKYEFEVKNLISRW